ncbi:MAG TPA: MotA/TolQ/ExbB proton channel family protein [Candidatus Krumholzibacteria bacterium]|nr:MotA/TolQ/ExbB proton channel family protein [Candidatus Krumholzibacteria bacterium]
MFGDMSIVDLFIASPTMLVLLVCSIVTLGFALERALYFAQSRANSRDLLKKIANKIQAANLAGAVDVAKKDKSAAGRVLAQGLAHAGLGRTQLTERMNTAIEVEQVEMERNLGVLGTMSNIAPLLGLFGTVVGIIRAFAAIARTGSGGSQVVAMGVSEALMTTAAGIIVAVIATVCFNVFVRKIRTRVVDLEDAREELLVHLAAAAGNTRRSAPRSTSNSTTPSQQEPVPAGFLS